jgi:Ca2+/Na+ antiporter
MNISLQIISRLSVNLPRYAIWHTGGVFNARAHCRKNISHFGPQHLNLGARLFPLYLRPKLQHTLLIHLIFLFYSLILYCDKRFSILHIQMCIYIYIYIYIYILYMYRVYLKCLDKLHEWVSHIKIKKKFVETYVQMWGFLGIIEKLHSTTLTV